MEKPGKTAHPLYQPNFGIKPLEFPPHVNQSTRKTLETIKQFLDAQYPRSWIPGMRETPEYHKILADNQKLHAAFNRYVDAVCKPNPVFQYIKDHLDEGFTPEEWTIFNAGLGLRVLPAISMLGYQDSFARGGDFHHGGVKYNYGVETGMESRSHIDLFFDFSRAMHETFGGKVPLLSDIRIYDMVKHILKLRREGVELNNVGNIYDSKRLFDEQLIKKQRILPHHIYEGWRHGLRAGIEDFKHRAAVLGDGDDLLPTGEKPQDSRLPLDGINPETQLGWGNQPYKDYRSLEDCYRIALPIAALLPTNFLNYGEITYQNQLSIMRNPSDLASQLKNALITLTREDNAGKGSHIDATLKLMQQYAGYVPKALKSQATQWAATHVDDNVGVEEDHANDARKWFMFLLRGWELGAQEGTLAEPLTATFDFLVQHDYPPLQQAHMQAMVDAMQKARSRATSPLIKPNPEKSSTGPGFVGYVQQRRQTLEGLVYE